MKVLQIVAWAKDGSVSLPHRILKQNTTTWHHYSNYTGYLYQGCGVKESSGVRVL